MHVLIFGAAGMIGRKLTHALLKRGELRGKAIGRLTLADIVAPETPDFVGEVGWSSELGYGVRPPESSAP